MESINKLNISNTLQSIKSNNIENKVNALKGQDKEKLKKACYDFESIFVKMMLDEMQKSTSIESSFGKGAGGAFFKDMYNNQLSSDIVKQSPSGIAGTMYKQLTGEDLDISGENEIFDGMRKLNRDDYLRINRKNIEIKTPLSMTKRYSKFIDSYSEKIGVDSALVKSIVLNESGGDYRAVSNKGAKGLMQLMDSTAKDLKVSNPFDPYQNLKGGINYLKKMLEKYNNDIDLSLAAYNAGPGNVDKYKGIPPFKETENYVKKVKESIKLFK
ncbi:MAG: hypothetical protein CR982_07515 [Candidatus Cloacimonadota bacterium]|nr:MAG: hypothetical protein CR982_07515 [Candidatus Cloacimonadota bacterium]PIE80178.1 MAG: hypothetical protein CSA15_02160 [Candidatus Delongbacteria bacterium]